MFKGSLVHSWAYVFKDVSRSCHRIQKVFFNGSETWLTENPRPYFLKVPRHVSLRIVVVKGLSA